VWGGDIMVKNLFDFLVTAIETETLEHTSLENESREYRHASQEAENCYRKIKTILPPEMQETLLRCKLCSGNPEKISRMSEKYNFSLCAPFK